MAEIKAHEFDQFAKRRAKDYHISLVYGPDRGLVSERATLLAKLSGVDKTDPFSFMRLDASDLTSDPGRLYDEALSTGLFGGDKLLWIKGAGQDKGLADAVTRLAKENLDRSWIIIEAGDLKKGANLRKAAESAEQAIAIPCYADDTKSLNALIDAELSDAGLKIGADARQLLLESLGGDRLASREEIRKLILYAHGSSAIETEHVIAIVGDASAISTDDALDAILKGDRVGFLHATQKVIASKTPVFLVLQGCLKLFQMLDLMRSEMEEKRMSATDVMATQGRHIHFRRKPILENALRAWTPDAIAKELNRLQATILQSRKNNALEDSIAIQTLLALTLAAARHKSSQR